MSAFTFASFSYPNGTPYEQVAMNGVDLGHLTKTEDGFTAPGWRKPAASKDDALEKMRAAGVAERKRQIAALQVEIDKLAAA